MYRQLLQLLMFVILVQSTLAAADAHVLHEISGEATHHHLYNDNSTDVYGADAVHSPKVSQPLDGDVSDDQACHHHCCHGHNFKYLNESLALPSAASDLTIGWGYSAHYLPPLVAPEFRPPIV